MTNVITRYFDSVPQALSVRKELLHRRRFSAKIVRLYENADGLADKLTDASVDAKTAKAYQKRMAKGGVVLMVMAGHKPLSVAQTTRDVTAQMGAVDMGGLIEEVSVPDRERSGLSVMTDHRHMLTRARDPYTTNFHMADWPFPLIIRRVPFSDSIFAPHARMANFPIPLLSDRKPFTGSIFGRHARMANFPIPLISKRKPYTGTIIAPHARMANFPIPLISKRQPSNRSIFPRHMRMANWPFPLLINGKTGTNALMLGGPRMAAFPISLLSKRKPFTGSIFSRHARMANFPISLISKRKPFTGSAFPRHARMANFILPLIIKDRPGGKRFSFSKMLGLPTTV